MTTTATADSYRQRFVFPDNIAIGPSDLPVSPGHSSLMDMHDAPLDMLNNPMSRNTSPLLYYSGTNSGITNNQNNHNKTNNNNQNNNNNNNSNQTPASRPSSGIFLDDIELPPPGYHAPHFDPVADLIDVSTDSRRQSLKSNPFIQPQQLQHQQPDTFPSSSANDFSRAQPPPPPPLQSTPGHIKKPQNPFKKHTTSLPACPSLESLIQLDTQHSAASKEYTIKARCLEQTLIYNNVVNRLQYSLSTLTINLADRFKSDPAAFTPAYTQAIDFVHTILKEDMTFADHRFASFLKPSNQKLLDIFLLLIKSSPSFICASLSRMNITEVNAFCSSPSDPYENLASCHRTNALDIIFHSFFPPNAPVLQKFQYFSFIVAFLLDNYLPTERYTRLCLAIIDRFVSPARFTMFQSFEPALLGFLRDGNFILKSSHRFSVLHDPQPSAFQTYSRPFNSTPPSSYQQSESHLAASMNLMNNNYFNSSPSLSLQMATAVPYIDTDTTSISSVHLHSDDIEFDSKRTTFINDAVLQFLKHLNSCRAVLFGDLVHFVRLVVHKISPGNKLTILRFIFFEFFFKHMLQTLFASPETYALVKDFYVTTDQRNKILIPIYQTCLGYTEATVFKDQIAVNVPQDIASQIDRIYEYFLTTLDSADDEPDDSVAHQNIIDGDVLDHLGELHEIKESIYSGQLLVLSPADVYTLYTSLFPFSSVQPRKNSITSTTSSNPNTISNQTTGSISSYGYHSHKRSSSTGYTSTGASTPTRTDMASFPKPYQKLDDLNILLSDYDQSDSPLFGSKREDGPCQWNLDDVYLDIEPAFDELVKKFPYLQFLSQPVHATSLRAHKAQNLRLPTPASEKWQVFYIGEPAAVYAVDEDTLVDKMCLLEKNRHGDNPFAADFVKSPLPASAQPYVNVVVSALEKLISQSSISGSTWRQQQQHMQYHQSENYPFASYMTESRPLFMDAFMAPPPLRRAAGSESPSYIIDLLANSAEQSISTNNFLDGGKYSNAIEALLRILPPENSTSYEHICAEINSYLMRIIKRDKERRIESFTHRLRKCDEYINPYATAIQFASHDCENTLQMLGDLRTKVFYATEVRSNAMWVRARDIISALNRGSSCCNNDKDAFDDTARSPVSGPGTHNGHHSYRSYTLKRNSSTSSLSSLGAYTFKRLTGGTTKRDYSHKRASFAHYVGASNTGNGPGDAMFAPEEYGGANKLSDKEAQATLNWLEGQNIERFCDGEELIHRFFCELDDLVKRFTTADSSSGANRRSQSIIGSSSLYKHDLGKLIFEVEGVDRSSTTSVSGVYPSKSSFYKFRSSSCTKLEAEPTSSRRKSIDGSITGGSITSITGGGSSNSAGGTSDNTASNSFQGRPKTTLFPAAELSLSRSYSLRGHKSLKSSPNLIEMFGSLDVGAPPTISSSPSFKKLNDFYPKSHHERSFSTSDSNRADGGNGFHSNNSSLHNAGASVGTTDEFGIGRVVTPLADDIGRLKNEERRKELEQMIIELQMKLTGLAFSDIGIEGWLEGSEMDKWFNSQIVDKSITRAFKAQEAIAAAAATMGPATDSNRNSWRQQPPMPTTPSDQNSTISNLLSARFSGKYHFPYESAYRHLLFKFSVTPSPSGKLAVLSELVRLVVSYLTTFPAQPSSTAAVVSSYRIHSSKPSLGSDSVPLTPRGGGTGDELKTLSNKPSLTNIELKRLSSNTGYGPAGNSPLMASAGKTHTSDHRCSNIGPNTDAIAGELRKIFRTNRAHCGTLFRDLQMIASFIPSHVLDLTDMGKAFWDVSLAVLSLKTEYLRVMVQTASELFEYSTHMLSPAMDIAFLSEWTLKDCAWLWSIAARVGMSEAQRELGIMNLSNPEITPLALMPFSKLTDVFSDEAAGGAGGGAGGGGSSRHDEGDKMDPVRMAIVRHWMGLAAAQGDLIAREYLEQNGFSGL